MKILLYIFTVLSMGFACSETESNPSSTAWSDCGGLAGDHACDFTLMDQSGADWSLYDHYGSIIVLDFSAMWCGYCQKAAVVAQNIQDSHKAHNVVWVTILLQNNHGQQPSLTDLNEWADTFEMSSAPVLSGGADIIDLTAQAGFNVSTWPGIVIINRDMVIAYELAGWNEAQIKSWLDQMTSGEKNITPP